MNSLYENLHEIYTHLLLFGIGIMVAVLWIMRGKNND